MIVAELDGSLFDRPIAAFRVIPYLARKSIPLPPLQELLNDALTRFKEMKDSEISDPEEIPQSSHSQNSMHDEEGENSDASNSDASED